ncbi:ion transporter [Desulfocurvibacter africanus]|uniref:ion transporter n=1 Tax=Desulfocurvibacter africanus TaxID=873 RepID=UPI0003FC670D|nr:ion transporter [Desulfocurvibacter africanus]
MSREDKGKLREERFEALHQLEDWLDWPVVFLSFVWLGLFIAEMIWGLGPILQGLVYAIWFIFIVDVSVRFVLAPDKLDFLKSNVLTILSLVLPALRVFRALRALRVLQAARAARGLRLVQVVGSINRSMGALRTSMRRRGLGYVALLTVAVVLAGAAGMLALEGGADSKGFTSYGDTLWWTAMIITSLGSEFWPQTPEGRILGFLISLYGFAVFGYITASIASILVGSDARREEGVAGAKAMAELKKEIATLREEIAAKSRE